MIGQGLPKNFDPGQIDQAGFQQFGHGKQGWFLGEEKRHSNLG
jgi:hypothetical protein